jgi:hypothetical protein
MNAISLLLRTRRDGDCLVWTGAAQSSGYGSVGVGNRKTALVHRVIFELTHGPIPDGQQVDHVKALGCRNRLCINPAHLEAVTARENVHRAGHGEQTHCKRNHPLSGPNLLMKRRPSGAVLRNCRTCQRESQRRWRARVATAAA